MTSKLDITRYRGDTTDHVLVVKNSKNKPVNIHGWKLFTLTVDPSMTPVDSTNNISTSLGDLTTNGLDGSISVPMDGTLVAGSYFYDLQATTSDDKVITLAVGKYTVLQDITK